jgi:predicted peptidase
MAKIIDVRLWISVLFAASLSHAVSAAEYFEAELTDGTLIDYALVLPDGFDSARTYPALLAFPPGPQTRAMVDAGLQSYWENMAIERGYIVVSSIAPDGHLFFQGGASLVPEFLDVILESLPIEDELFHVTGISNGGLSGFRVALDYPERFLSLMALPGFPPGEGDLDTLDRLDGMAINMFVGEFDQFWRERMVDTSEELARLGQPVHFEVLPGEGHVMRAIARAGAARLFDLLPE